MELRKVLFSQFKILYIKLLGIVCRIDELEKIKKLPLVILKGCAYSMLVVTQISVSSPLTGQQNPARDLHVPKCFVEKAVLVL